MYLQMINSYYNNKNNNKFNTKTKESRIGVTIEEVRFIILFARRSFDWICFHVIIYFLAIFLQITDSEHGNTDSDSSNIDNGKINNSTKKHTLNDSMKQVRFSIILFHLNID